MSIVSDLDATSSNSLKIGLTGVKLVNNSGNLTVSTTDGLSTAEVTASKLNVSGDSLDLNSDAAGSGSDYKYTLTRPASGMTANVTLTLPSDDGTPGQVMATDGNGNLSFIAAANTALCDKVDTTSFAFDSVGTITMFTTGAADTISRIDLFVDTAFNGTAPSASIGIVGDTAKYFPANRLDLKSVGLYQYHPGLVAQGAEALKITLVADSSSAGAGRVEVHYATPA